MSDKICQCCNLTKAIIMFDFEMVQGKFIAKANCMMCAFQQDCNLLKTRKRDRTSKMRTITKKK